MACSNQGQVEHQVQTEVARASREEEHVVSLTHGGAVDVTAITRSTRLYVAGSPKASRGMR